MGLGMGALVLRVAAELLKALTRSKKAKKKDAGNLSHIHLILEVDKINWSEEETYFMLDCMRRLLAILPIFVVVIQSISILRTCTRIRRAFQHCL